MFEVITLEKKDAERWNNSVKGFADLDIYYDRDYFISLEKYTDSKIVLFFYKDQISSMCYVMQINDISKDKHFKFLPRNKFFDMETPYGYGGIISDSFCKESSIAFIECVKNYCEENGIITQFIRFNPITDNYALSKQVTEIVQVKSTICLHLESEEQILFDMDSKNRNMVRKAEKAGIIIKRMDLSEKDEVQKSFISLYKSTMDRNCADEFYYFSNEYFEDFFSSMDGKYEIFYAQYQGIIIASAIIMKKNSFLHYYLSAADRAYMNLAPNNLLLFSVANWGCQNGYKLFHLGGGVYDNDKLYSFKKSFNRHESKDFYVGRNIFDQQKYDYLVSLRCQNDHDFDLDKKYLIKYRQE